MDESTSPAPQLPPEASDDGFAFSLRALREAWADVLANDLEDGVTAPGVVRFADDEPAQLSRLHRQLAEGTYVPQPLTELAIPKDGDSGAVRKLQIPAVRDRVVSRATLAAIAPRADRHLGSAAFAYRPGLGVVDAVDMVVSLRESGCGWVLRTDVDDCFPTIPVELARRRLGALVDDSIVLGVADVLLARRVIAAGHRGSRPLRGLAQGCALSPVLETLQRWFRVSRLNGHAVRLAMQRIETPWSPRVARMNRSRCTSRDAANRNRSRQEAYPMLSSRSRCTSRDVANRNGGGVRAVTRGTVTLYVSRCSE